MIAGQNATARTFPHPRDALQGVLQAADSSQRDERGLWLPCCVAARRDLAFWSLLQRSFHPFPTVTLTALRGLPEEPRPSALIAEVSWIKPRSLSRIPLQHSQLLQALVYLWHRLDFSFWLRTKRAVLSPPPTSKGLSQRKPWIRHLSLTTQEQPRVGHRLLSAAEVKDATSWLSAPS